MVNPRKAGVLSASIITAAILLQRFPGIDFTLQDLFWNPVTKSFFLPPEDPILRLFFYSGPKNLIITIGLFVLGRAIFLLKSKRAAEAKAHFYALLALAIIPAICTPMKAHTAVACPNELIRYGGGHEFEAAVFSFASIPSPRCFPAGHASGGFALMGLAFIPLAQNRKRLFLLGGFLIGNLMGGYQMLRGTHFFSHTLVTIGIAIGVLGFLTFMSHRSVRILSDSSGKVDKS